MLMRLLLPCFLLSNFSACSQSDRLLHSDEAIGIFVYQSDLDDYLAKRPKMDTTGRTKQLILLLKEAKFNCKVSLKRGDQPPISLETGIELAEEYRRRRTQVDKILVVKHKRKLYLLKKTDTIKSFSIALGPNPVGQKEYEGDGRTPEGHYTLDWQRWETPVFHSFHISYPNKADSLRAKVKGFVPGSNIMVHGTSKGVKKKRDWTNGCVALTNKDMVEFRKIVFQGTDIEIIK